jgi:hypothetical protein
MVLVNVGSEQGFGFLQGAVESHLRGQPKLIAELAQ